MNKKKKIKWWHILLSFVLVILVAVGAVVALQYKNIMAFYKGVTTDSETLKQAIADNQKETADALSGVGMNVSEDDFNKMNSGSLSKEEISDILYNSISAGEELTVPDDTQNTQSTEQTGNDNTGNADAVQPGNNGGIVPDDKNVNEQDNQPENEPEKEQHDSTVTGVPPQTPDKAQGNASGNGTVQLPSGQSGSALKPSTAPAADNKPAAGSTQTETTAGALPEAEYNKKVADLVAQMYVIKANFIGTLDAFEDKIMSAWDAQPKEMKTQKNKAKIIADNTAYLVGLEAQCDAQVKAVTDELKTLMTAQGKDTSLVDSIVSAYEKEKENRKAYYISEYS